MQEIYILYYAILPSSMGCFVLSDPSVLFVLFFLLDRKENKKSFGDNARRKYDNN